MDRSEDDRTSEGRQIALASEILSHVLHANSVDVPAHVSDTDVFEASCLLGAALSEITMPCGSPEYTVWGEVFALKQSIEQILRDADMVRSRAAHMLSGAFAPAVSSPFYRRQSTATLTIQGHTGSHTNTCAGVDTPRALARPLTRRRTPHTPARLPTLVKTTTTTTTTPRFCLELAGARARSHSSKQRLRSKGVYQTHEMQSADSSVVLVANVPCTDEETATNSSPAH